MGENRLKSHEKTICKNLGKDTVATNFEINETDEKYGAKSRHIKKWKTRSRLSKKCLKRVNRHIELVIVCYYSLLYVVNKKYEGEFHYRY